MLGWDRLRSTAVDYQGATKIPSAYCSGDLSAAGMQCCRSSRPRSRRDRGGLVVVDVRRFGRGRFRKNFMHLVLAHEILPNNTSAVRPTARARTGAALPHHRRYGLIQYSLSRARTRLPKFRPDRTMEQASQSSWVRPVRPEACPGLDYGC